MEVQPLNVVVDMHLINEIRDDFEKQMKGFSKELKVTAPKEPENALAMEGEQQKGRKLTTKLIGEIPFSFVLPEVCIQKNINIDMLLSTHSHGEGRLDNFYHHLPSGLKFRSRPGVIQFVLYETSPPPKPRSKGQKAKDHDNDPGSASNASSNETASFSFPQGGN
ncbi:hypothetical protein SESBI_08422 [Sesbania bispinosa]|nr:hypothetical protein SESBI_08422 [Sesbania bispinosa]